MENLILPFNNNIDKFYSQAGQDVFVLSVLDGMRNGRFLDIGCNDPKIISNSYLLESEFDWTGVLIDLESNLVEACKKERTSTCVCGDATVIDYSRLFREENFSNIIDYISIDIDGLPSFRVLERLPLNNYKARVITFEHNAYLGEYETRELSRKYLRDSGYYRLCSDVNNDGCAYEDWYVHPELVDIERVRTLKADNKEWRNILFK
jgi:hypothetical protein